MNKYIKIFPILMGAIFFATPALAATKANVNTSRIFEDGVWAIVFIVITVFAMIMTKIMKEGSMKNVYLGYLILLTSGITGFLWKFIGFIKRAFGIGDPKWIFDLSRELLEGATGLLFAVAFIILFIGITRKK